MSKSKGLLLLSSFLVFALVSCGSSGSSSLATTDSSASSASTTSSKTNSSTHTGPGGGGSTSTVTYAGANVFTSDAEESGKTYASTSADESAVLVKNGANVTLTNPTITKSGDTSSADNSSFYGQNASLLSIAGNAYVKGGTVTSTGEGGAGLCGFSSGVVYADGTQISTSKNAAGGVHVCGGGTVYGWNLGVQTQGEHSAAVRSDRGGGTINLNGGTYVSNGAGSPAVYSTADISINNATLTANGSEAAAIEGKNSIKIFNSTMSGNLADSSQNDNTWGVILYQSMSGDSTVGTSEFAMVDSTLDIKNGGFFHSTNTSSEFLLHNTVLNHTDNDSYEYLIRATGSSRWGSGTGPDMNFTASAETMEGKVVYDTASTLNLYLKDSSTWTGSLEKSTTYSGSKATSVYVESGSKWIVDGNSTCANVYNGGQIVDKQGAEVKVVDASGNTLKAGTSAYTITISGTYASSASMDGAVATPSYSSISEPTAIQ